MNRSSLRIVTKRLARLGIVPVKTTPTEYGAVIRWSNGETRAYSKTDWAI